MKRHTKDDHFNAFRQTIRSLQLMADAIALNGAVGPLLVWDSIQETGVRRFRFSSVNGSTDRVLITEVLGHLRSCCHSIPISAVLLRTQLVRPQPDLQVRATIIGYTIASEHVWCSEATIVDRSDAPTVWAAVNDERHADLIQPAAAYLRFCNAQGVLYA